MLDRSNASPNRLIDPVGRMGMGGDWDIVPSRLSDGLP